jgi:hypothetical protein
MSSSLTTDQMITNYLSSTVEAIWLLYGKDLYGQLLIIIYSSIDTLGLLDAPPSQSTTSGASFKNWSKKYLLSDPNIEFSDIDLWAARCAVLHTFTSESNLSKSGKAKELQYYAGDKSSPELMQFVSATKSIDGGKHLPVHFEDLIQAFISGFERFVHDLDTNCTANAAYTDRLYNILQPRPMDSAS